MGFQSSRWYFYIIILFVPQVPLALENVLSTQDAQVLELSLAGPYKKSFQQNCAHCHDSRVAVPWYGQFLRFVNPVWSDVMEGRAEFDIQKIISDEPEYSARKIRDLMKASRNLVKNEEMPPTLYKLVRPRIDDKKGLTLSLPDRERKQLLKWFNTVLRVLKPVENLNNFKTSEERVTWIFKENCIECHSPQSAKDNGSFTRLLDFSYVERNYMNKKVPEKSKLFEMVKLKMNSRDEFLAEMPHDRDPLGQAEISAILEWIEDRARE